MLNLTLSPISRTRVYPFAPLVNFMTNLKENKKTISISREFAGEVITSTQFFPFFFLWLSKKGCKGVTLDYIDKPNNRG